MSPKQGVFADYDSHANHEPAAQQGNECVTCGAKPACYIWSDYSGEGMCNQCGTPYQLKWGSDEQKAEGKYPYLNLRETWVPVVRRYYAETQAFTYLGTMFVGSPPGQAEFFAWVKERDAAPPKPTEEAEDKS